MSVTFTNLIGIDRSAAGTDERTYGCALLAACKTTNGCTTKGGSSHSQFIPVFFPKSAMTAMAYSCLR